MQDYNFFEPFEKGRKKPERSQVSWAKIGILILVGVLVWPGINFVQLMLLNNQIEEMEQTLLTSPDYPRIAEVDRKLVQLADEQRLLSQMEEAGRMIDGKEVIDEQLLFTITSAMPPDTTLSNMSISGREISMQGEAGSKPAIAELEFNLRNTGQFESIFVPSITEDEEAGWVFNLFFAVKGEMTDETD